MIVTWPFLTMPRVCLQFVIVVFPDHTYLLFFIYMVLLSSRVKLKTVLLLTGQQVSSLPNFLLSVPYLRFKMYFLKNLILYVLSGNLNFTNVLLHCHPLYDDNYN